MYGSLSAGSPHIVEPDCRADSRVWTDLLLWRSNPSEYLHGRYAWICGTSSRPHPSRLLHLEYASSGGLSAQGTTWIPMVPTSDWEGAQLRAALDRQAQVLRAPALQAPSSQALVPQAPQMAPPCASHSHLPGVGRPPHTSRQFSC